MSNAQWLAELGRQAADRIVRRRRANLRESQARAARRLPYTAETFEPRILLSVTPVFFHSPQTLPAGTAPQSIAVADFNGDGKPDMAVANFADNTVSIMLGNGKGAFTPQQTIPIGHGPTALVATDIDKDGHVDLIVANQTDGTVEVLFGNGTGSFVPGLITPVGNGPRAIAVGDFNGDGIPDIAIANSLDGTVSVLLGGTDESFNSEPTVPAVTGIHSLAVGDFNHDGKLDIVAVGLGQSDAVVLPGNGNGTFGAAISTGLATPAACVAVTDINRDGVPDLIVADPDGTVDVYQGNGDSTFALTDTYTLPQPAEALALRVADFNGDGIPDVVVTTSQPVLDVLLGTPQGLLTAGPELTTASNPSLPAVADVNGDGSPDIIVGNTNSASVSVLLNDPPPALISIARTSPSNPVTQSNSVTFTATFTEPVSGLTADDFFQSSEDGIELTPPPGAARGDGPFLTPTSGPSASYTLTVNNITGSGDLLLGLLPTDGPIVNDAGEQLKGFLDFGGAPFSGPDGQDIAIGDLNGDGKPDVVLADATDNQVTTMLGAQLNGQEVLQSRHDYSTGANSQPNSVALGDFNGDGNLDVVTADSGTQFVSIFLGNGNGTLGAGTMYLSGAGPSSVAVADINGDGKPDLIVANQLANTVSVMLGAGGGAFDGPMTLDTGAAPSSVAVADINGDGRPDIVVANSGDSTISVFLNETPPAQSHMLGSSFAAPLTIAAGGPDQTVRLADVNGDGRLDIVTEITSSQNPYAMVVFPGNGNGTFGSAITTPGDMSANFQIADMNSDGIPDVVGTSDGSVLVMGGHGDGTFQDPQLYNPQQNIDITRTAVADMNGDGLPDVVGSNEAIPQVAVETNAPGDITFSEPYTILKRDAIVAVTGTDAIFDGNPHPALFTAVDVNGVDVSGQVSISYADSADNITTTPPTQIGDYEILYTVAGTDSLNAVPLTDSGREVIISPLSAVQSIPSVKLPSALLVAGGKIKPIKLNIKLTNTGSDAFSHDVQVRVELSSSPLGTDKDFVAGHVERTAKLKGHQTSSFGAVTIGSLPAGLNGTVYVLLKLTDATGAANIASAGTIKVAPPTTDLAAVSLTAPPKAKRGQRVTATIGVISHGNVPFAHSVPVEFFLSTDNTLDGGDIPLQTPSGHLSVQPGKKGMLHLPVTIPSSVTAGSYFLIATLDPANTLGDSNLTNNTVASGRKIVVS